MEEAVNTIRGRDDWNPTFYILGLKAIVKVWSSPMAVAIVQYIFYGFVLIRGLMLLNKLGISKQLQYITLIVTVLSSANSILATSIIKDAPFTYAITWLLISMANIAYTKNARWCVYVEFILATVGTCLFRQPGIVPGVATGIALLISLKRNKKVWITVLISFLLVAFIKGPFYSYYDISNHKSGSIYSGMGQEILGVYYNGGELSEDALHIVKEFSYDEIDRSFSPYFAKDGCGIDDTMPKFIGTYMKTFVKNPILVLRTIMCRTDYLWNVTLGEDGIYPTKDTGTEDQNEDWSRLWDTRVENVFTSKLDEWVDYTVNNEIIYIIDWRTGLSFLLTILSAGALLIKNKKNRAYLLFIPLLAQVISLVLSTGWSQFRYSRPINMMSIFVLPIALWLFDDKRELINNVEVK